MVKKVWIFIAHLFVFVDSFIQCWDDLWRMFWGCDKNINQTTWRR